MPAAAVADTAAVERVLTFARSQQQKNFELALQKYSEGIELYPGDGDDELALFYTNRAAVSIKMVSAAHPRSSACSGRGEGLPWHGLPRHESRRGRPKLACVPMY